MYRASELKAQNPERMFIPVFSLDFWYVEGMSRSFNRQALPLA
jgi:hypothetical protein